MLRNWRGLILKNNVCPLILQKKNFLTNDYKCTEAWNNAKTGPVFEKINIQDFYNIVDQNYSSKGVISAIDVDIFANSIKDSSHLEELKDLLNKLRLSAQTNDMLDSTGHATVRNFLEFGEIEDLVGVLKDPLNFGVFLDDYAANILVDRLITSSNFELAARVASIIMLQEEYINEITNCLCQYACYKYIEVYTPPVVAPPENKKAKVEEIKIRVKYLRNPYFDDHFDIKELITLSGKTLAWMSQHTSDNLNNNLQLIGWLYYKKYDKLQALSEKLSKEKSFKIYNEVIQLLQKECEQMDEPLKQQLEKCITTLNNVQHHSDSTLEESLKVAIENAINKSQKLDISQQETLYKTWAKTREEKLAEQTKRLDRARRIQVIEEKQKELQQEEQKLWFFENEDKIDLQIEEKEKLEDKSTTKKTVGKATTEDYIPPEIRPKRK